MCTHEIMRNHSRARPHLSMDNAAPNPAGHFEDLIIRKGLLQAVKSDVHVDPRIQFQPGLSLPELTFYMLLIYLHISISHIF